jgi:hypothetical protein
MIRRDLLSAMSRICWPAISGFQTNQYHNDAQQPGRRTRYAISAETKIGSLADCEIATFIIYLPVAFHFRCDGFANILRLTG